MIYKIVIGLVVLALALYYLVCFLEMFGVIKFTKKETVMTFGKLIIPFYYLIKD